MECFVNGFISRLESWGTAFAKGLRLNLAVRVKCGYNAFWGLFVPVRGDVQDSSVNFVWKIKLS